MLEREKGGLYEKAAAAAAGRSGIARQQRGSRRRGLLHRPGVVRALGLDADDGAAKAVTAACGPGTDPDGEREHESEELFAGRGPRL